MQYAIQIAEQNINEVPVGCVIIDKNNNIIGIGKNQIIEKCDPLAHAEIQAIRAASLYIQTPRLIDCSIYVTLEPCAMCLHAIKLAKIKNLYIGAKSTKNSENHTINIYDCILEKECNDLLNIFFKNKRLK